MGRNVILTWRCAEKIKLPSWDFPGDFLHFLPRYLVWPLEKTVTGAKQGLQGRTVPPPVSLFKSIRLDRTLLNLSDAVLGEIKNSRSYKKISMENRRRGERHGKLKIKQKYILLYIN